MDERRVSDYFVVAGLPETPQHLEEAESELARPAHKLDPITDITVINKSADEECPHGGWTIVDKTPGGLVADLNSGSIRCPEIFLCYKRGRKKLPLIDIGVLYEGKERLIDGCEAVFTTVYGSSANVNNSNNPRVYLTYKRAKEPLSPGELAVTDITVISKGDNPPPAFCQVHKSLNRAIVGNDVYVCYKKSIPKQAAVCYKPAVLSRYPIDDYPEFPFPSEVALFCLPMGAKIQSWLDGAKFPYPQFSTFVLTLDSGDKVFGSVVSFYEDFPDSKLNEEEKKELNMTEKEQEKATEGGNLVRTAFCNRAICILSHYPFFRAFEKFLIYLYRLSISGPHLIPIERFISHFIHEVPFPTPHRPTILVQLNHDELTLSLPEDSPLPNSGSSFVEFLTNLNPENCITLLLYALMENKIVLHSLRRTVLTQCAESVSMMLFPLRWQCTYIPLCPIGLSYVLNAPTPVLVGLDSRYFDLYYPPSDVICVDLDTHNIAVSEERRLAYKMLPKKAARNLKNTLLHLAEKVHEWKHKVRQDENDDEYIGPYDISLRIHRAETLFELAIQEAFLKFMASVLKGYKQFLKPITSASSRNATDAHSLFDMQGTVYILRNPREGLKLLSAGLFPKIL